ECSALRTVGITYYVEQSFIEHERDKPWWPQVAAKTVEWFDTRPPALAAELEAIHSESPIHNVNGKPWAETRRPLEGDELSVAQLRAELSERWQHVHHTGRPVFVVDRKRARRRVVALVPFDFYVRACEALGEDRVLVETEDDD